MLQQKHTTYLDRGCDENRGSHTEQSIDDSQQNHLRLWLHALPFCLVHVTCFAAIWTGVNRQDLLLCCGLYLLRMFGVTAGYHRYFSHRSYKMGRAMQFVIAFLAQTSAQRGVLWWAGHHRHHHKCSDGSDDPHSPHHEGFWWSHVGWFLFDAIDHTDPKLLREFRRYPELIWLNRHPYLAAAAVGVLSFVWAGWSGLVVGFLWSTVLLWHATFAINSLAHTVGTQRYETGDLSRNNWFLALITLGEGWHNNHHHYQSSARQGFFWWEIDITYYILKFMSKLGLVWDVREPPQHVLS